MCVGEAVIGVSMRCQFGYGWGERGGKGRLAYLSNSLMRSREDLRGMFGCREEARGERKILKGERKGEFNQTAILYTREGVRRSEPQGEVLCSKVVQSIPYL